MARGRTQGTLDQRCHLAVGGSLTLSLGIQLMKMSGTAIAAWNHDLWVYGLDGSGQRLKRAKAAIVEGPLHGPSLQKRVARLRASSRDLTADL
ncbi:MAG: hypothetical protein ABSF93_08395 [Candidatus Sulfotelmatobacter sp.]